MRYRIFLDTNVLLSGIFFEGNEAKLLLYLEIPDEVEVYRLLGEKEITLLSDE